MSFIPPERSIRRRAKRVGGVVAILLGSALAPATASAADAIAPETTGWSGPPASTTSTTATFAFTSSEAGSTFACRLDGGPWTACMSPTTIGGLTIGPHTGEVRATDPAGNTDTTPATHTWTVIAPTGESSRLYMASTGSDANACTPDKPCKTLARAYSVAKPGQTVEVAAGTYTDTSLPRDPAKTSQSDVVFVPAPLAAVSFSRPLSINAKHVELAGMRFTSRVTLDATAEDVTLRGNDLAIFDILSNAADSPTEISIIGGDVGPAVDVVPRIGSNGTSTTASPRNVLIDNVTFHDFVRSAGSSAHVECLQAWAALGLTIRNSRFRNCEAFDILMQKLPGGSAPAPSSVLIENNVFDCCRSGSFSIRMSDHPGTSWKDITIRNNSFNKALNPDPGVPYSNVKIIGNIAPELDFYAQDTGRTEPRPAGVTADYNVWYGAGVKFGANDQIAPSGYRDAAALDFHLVPGAAAIDRGDPANAPATDMDGDARPQGRAPDAGADEAVTAVAR